MRAPALQSTATDAESWVRLAAGCVGILAALSAAGVKAWRWFWRRRRTRAAERRAIRYLVDAQHHVLRLLDHRLVPEDEIRQQELLVRLVRRELAEVDGHEELLQESDERAREMEDVMRRTQRIEARKKQIRATRQQDNPFADGWEPGDAE